MPCWTRQSMSVDMKAADLDLLQAAVDALGFQSARTSGYLVLDGRFGRIVIGGGRAELDERDMQTLDQIKRGYSQQVLRAAARRSGWTVQEKDQEHVVLRRY